MYVRRLFNKEKGQPNKQETWIYIDITRLGRVVCASTSTRVLVRVCYTVAWLLVRFEENVRKGKKI